MPHHSQSNEDQIIHDIFHRMQVDHGAFVELGAQDGIQLSNTRNLYERGWNGVLIEANPSFKDTLSHNSPKTQNFISKVSLEEGNQLDDILDLAGYGSSYHLLSLDIDGIEYWVLKNMRRKPFVICVEYNSHYDDSRTVAYDPNFSHQLDDYYGATPKALQEALGEEYTPINFTNGLNVFFMRQDYVEFWGFHKMDLNRIPIHRGWPESQRTDQNWIEV